MIHFPYIFLRVGVVFMVSLPPGQQQLREEWASFGLVQWLGLDY
jgi:hypothetical protein